VDGLLPEVIIRVLSDSESPNVRRAHATRAARTNPLGGKTTALSLITATEAS